MGGQKGVKGLRKKTTVYEVTDDFAGFTMGRRFVATAAGQSKQKAELNARISKELRCEWRFSAGRCRLTCNSGQRFALDHEHSGEPRKHM